MLVLAPNTLIINNKRYMKNIALKYGLWLFAGLTAFFLLMHLTGYSDNYDLRILNSIIHLSVIYLAIRAYRLQLEDSVNNYLSGVAMGMYTSAIGVTLFTVFMFLFMRFNMEFTEGVIANFELSDRFVMPIGASMFIFVEGIATSLIGSYIITRIIDMRMAKAQSSKA